MFNLFLLSVMLAIFGYTDLKEHKVYNSRVLTAFIVCVAVGMLTQGVLPTVVGSVVAFVITLIAYIVGMIGGGDVKLITACGAMIGAAQAVELLKYSVIIGAVAGIVIIAIKLIRKVPMREVLKTQTAFVPFCFLGSLILIAENIIYKI